MFNFQLLKIEHGKIKGELRIARFSSSIGAATQQARMVAEANLFHFGKATHYQIINASRRVVQEGSL